MDATVSPAPQPAKLDDATIRTIVIGVLLAMLLAALDQTIVATALPTIGRELGDLQNLSWVVTAYLLSSTAATPLYGKVSDIYGRRTTLLTAITIFMIGSVACALAPTMLALIIARFLQGLGGGGLISLSQTIVGDAMPPRERARYMGYFGAVFALSSVAGPVLGGVLSQVWHWSLIFWINIPLGALAFAMTASALRKLPRYERPHRIDFLGALLLVTAAVLLLLALSWGGVAYAWSSTPILGLFATSAIAWILFVIRLLKAPEPFLPLGMLNDRVVAFATLAGFFGIGTMVSLSIYLPLFFQSVLHLSAGASGVALIPMSIGTVVGAQTSGRVMVRVAAYKRLPIIGLVISALTMAALALFADRVGLVPIEIMLTIIGLGLGSLFPVTMVAVQSAVAPHHMGSATATLNFMRALGSAILVASFGAIFLAGVDRLATTGGSSVEEKVARAGEAGLSLGSAFSGVFFAAAIGIAIALVFFILMEERPIRGRPEAGATAVEL